MVISFQEKRVREFLLKNGQVYTFRYYNKDTPNGQRKQIGKDWANSGRGTCKIADVNVTPIEYLDALNMGIVLTKYVRESGFYPGRGRVDDSVSEWARKINTLHPNKPTVGWIYLVELVQSSTQEAKK